AHQRNGLGGSRSVDRVEVDQRNAPMGVTFGTGLDAGHAPDAATLVHREHRGGGVDVQRVGAGVEVEECHGLPFPWRVRSRSSRASPRPGAFSILTALTLNSGIPETGSILRWVR